ncbi:hypothetical protein GCM10011247_32710 [Pseudomonas plecoglossicida]|nr:hypothetical protein GCM10011247_32710 [Pseudomonas plecoglossicida]
MLCLGALTFQTPAQLPGMQPPDRPTAEHNQQEGADKEGGNVPKWPVLEEHQRPEQHPQGNPERHDKKSNADIQEHLKPPHQQKKFLP